MIVKINYTFLNDLLKRDTILYFFSNLFKLQVTYLIVCFVSEN
jgi:hypothetical protein